MKDWDIAQRLVVSFFVAGTILALAFLAVKLVADWPLIERELAAEREQNEQTETANGELRGSERAAREPCQEPPKTQALRSAGASVQAATAAAAFSIIRGGLFTGR